MLKESLTVGIACTDRKGTEVRYRYLAPDDSIDEITGMLHEAYAPLAKNGMRFVASYQAPSVTQERVKKGETIVAIDNGRLVGIITLAEITTTRGSPFYDRDDVASFGQFAVRPSHQGRGIGAKLLDLVEQRAREKGVGELALDTSERAVQLIELYKAKGYRFVEYLQWRDTNYRSMVFAKMLAERPSAGSSILRTDRLDLLPIAQQFAPSMFRVLNDPGLYEFTGGSPPKDVETLADRYKRWECGKSPSGSELWYNWLLHLRLQNELIGYVQATVLPEYADIAWVVGSAWQRHGYATEAAKAVLQWLLQRDVREIRASIHPAHNASMKIAEALGMHVTTESSGDERIWKYVAVVKSGIDVVEYSPLHREDLVRMWRASFEQGVGVIDPHTIEEQLTYFDDKVLPQNRVLVVVDRSTPKVIGFMAHTRDMISHLYVHVRSQHQGIGSLLLQRAKQESNGKLRLFTFRQNKNARQFYEKHGFKAVRYGFEENWQLEDVEYVWMEKTLG
jgi:RimJ/RimL family protein N-acetyltransferase